MTDSLRLEATSLLWPEGGLEAVACCPVCGSELHHLLHTQLTDRVFYCAPGAWTLFGCAQCGSAYLDPRPTTETIHLAYERYYTHTLPKQVEGTSLHGVSWVRRALTNGYRNWRFGTTFCPASVLGVFVTGLMPGKRRVIEREFRHLPRPTSGARLLDVGFGSGSFLDLAQAAGWQVSGCDTDSVTVASASKRGFDVRQGGIEAFSDMSESFDVITLSHVIEHVHHPREVTQEIYRLLKPGGQVWIETPNSQSYGHEHFAQNWRGLEPPRHLVLFSWKALEVMLKKCGFRDVERLPRYDLYTRLAAKSRAISSGRDPYEKKQLRQSERIMGYMMNLRARLFPERTEYITLVARKPCR